MRVVLLLLSLHTVFSRLIWTEVDEHQVEEPGFGPMSLREIVNYKNNAEGMDMHFGTAVNSELYGSNALYAALVDKEFDLTTAENDCKFGEIQHGGGGKVFNFTKCDLYVQRGLAAGHVMRGHTLIWGVHNPKWWYMAPYTSYTPDQLRGILKLHIDTVLKRYGDSLFAWDVVNECVADGTGTEIFKTNDWYPKVPDYVNLAFLQANASRKSTDVKLFLNDYGMESTIGWTKTKADKFYNLVKKMVNDNIPIDGVGFQLHVTVNTTIIEGVKLNMERFNKLGLEVHMTEVDVSCNFPNPCTNWDKDRETRQAEVYAALLAACMEAPNCTSFEIWGPSDLLTWRGSAQYPLPWDDKLVPKLAVTAMRETLLGDTKWSKAYYDRLRRENRVDKALPPPPASGL